jgi:hypothetical protein
MMKMQHTQQLSPKDLKREQKLWWELNADLVLRKLRKESLWMMERMRNTSSRDRRFRGQFLILLRVRWRVVGMTAVMIVRTVGRNWALGGKVDEEADEMREGDDVDEDDGRWMMDVERDWWVWQWDGIR